jgi:hypothetical protein
VHLILIEKKQEMDKVNKTKSLILLICKKMAQSNNLGSVLLNKTLYYIDNISYLKTGKTISGFSYVKQAQGPTPSPHQFMPIRETLISNGEIEINEVESFGFTRKVPVCKSEPELTHFKKTELELIDNVIRQLESFNATTISNISHSEISWELADKMEDLPFYTYLLDEDELNDRDIKWAQETSKKYEAKICS